MLLGYLAPGRGPWGHEGICHQGAVVGSHRWVELLGWAENGSAGCPFMEVFSSFEPLPRRNSYFQVWTPAPFSTRVIARRWQCWVEVGQSELKSSLGEHLLCASYRFGLWLSCWHVAGWISLLHFIERKLKSRKGECKLLIQCFICTATVDAKKIFQIHISAYTKQAGFEALPRVPCPWHLAVAQRTNQWNWRIWVLS